VAVKKATHIRPGQNLGRIFLSNGKHEKKHDIDFGGCAGL